MEKGVLFPFKKETKFPSYQEFVASRQAGQHRIRNLQLDMDMHRQGQMLLEQMRSLDPPHRVEAQLRHAQEEYRHMEAQLQAQVEQLEEELLAHLQELHARVNVSHELNTNSAESFCDGSGHFEDGPTLDEFSDAPEQFEECLFESFLDEPAHIEGCSIFG